MVHIAGSCSAMGREVFAAWLNESTRHENHRSFAEAVEREMGMDEFVQIVDHKHCGPNSGLVTGKESEQEQGFQSSRRRPDYRSVACR
jgi:hypothetical protein